MFITLAVFVDWPESSYKTCLFSLWHTKKQKEDKTRNALNISIHLIVWYILNWVHKLFYLNQNRSCPPEEIWSQVCFTASMLFLKVKPSDKNWSLIFNSAKALTLLSDLRGGEEGGGEEERRRGGGRERRRRGEEERRRTGAGEEERRRTGGEGGVMWRWKVRESEWSTLTLKACMYDDSVKTQLPQVINNTALLLNLLTHTHTHKHTHTHFWVCWLEESVDIIWFHKDGWQPSETIKPHFLWAPQPKHNQNTTRTQHEHNMNTKHRTEPEHNISCKVEFNQLLFPSVKVRRDQVSRLRHLMSLSHMFRLF